MSDPLLPFAVENKLVALNKKIVETKKKIQLSEGQRKAIFEECDVKKRSNAEKIICLKKEIKNLYMQYGKLRNNEGVAERATEISSECVVIAAKCNLEETILRIDESNVRLRKKYDLIKYQRRKLHGKLSSLTQECDKLVNGKMEKITKQRIEMPLKKKIISLEVQLERMRMMQIKADIVRRKYKTVYSGLKEKSIAYSSALKELEKNIQEQEDEIKRLQEIKEEAITLKDTTQETLVREEQEMTNSSKERDRTIQEYRQRVSERKTELERLERIMFLNRQHENFDNGERSPETIKDVSDDEMTRLKDAFAKLRSSTGVSRSEDVLNRFLGQRATKERLQRMRTATEQEKSLLEKMRQELNVQIESQKFSESRNTDQNAEEVKKLNDRITEEVNRQRNAEIKKHQIDELSSRVIRTLWQLCDKLRDVTDTSLVDSPDKVEDPLYLVGLIEERLKRTMEVLGGPDKFLQTLHDALIEKLETMSVATTTANGKANRADAVPLFPQFPSSTVLAVLPSEDEEEVPSRNVLKRQAQLLVDTKSRRKGFNFRR